MVMVALFMCGWLCLVGADGNIGVRVVLVAICWWQYRRLDGALVISVSVWTVLLEVVTARWFWWQY